MLLTKANTSLFWRNDPQESLDCFQIAVKDLKDPALQRRRLTTSV